MIINTLKKVINMNMNLLINLAKLCNYIKLLLISFIENFTFTIYLITNVIYVKLVIKFMKVKFPKSL